MIFHSKYDSLIYDEIEIWSKKKEILKVNEDNYKDFFHLQKNK